MSTNCPIQVRRVWLGVMFNRLLALFPCQTLEDFDLERREEDAEQLLEGEIMVASFTDIGWTPYFSIISGLITEIGSPLSHGAVVAREYGIPAVVAAKGAKKFLKTGDRVKLDGERGLIEKK